MGESLDGLDEYLGALGSVLDRGTRIGKLPYLFSPCLGVIISSTGGRSESESTVAADLYLQQTSVPIIKVKKMGYHEPFRHDGSIRTGEKHDRRTRELDWLIYILPANSGDLGTDEQCQVFPSGIAFIVRISNNQPLTGKLY